MFVIVCIIFLFVVSQIGLNAVNDAFMVEHVAYLVAERFSPSEHREAIIDLLRNTMWLTSVGQYLDGKYCYNASKIVPSTLPDGESKEEALLKKLDATLTTEHFLEICKMKTSYYTIVNPTKLGLLIAGINCTPEVLQLVEDICIKIGILFQAKDDYLDVYGDPSLFQKVGMDVEDGKCTWIVTSLLSHAESLTQSDPQTANRIRSVIAVCYFCLSVCVLVIHHSPYIYFYLFIHLYPSIYLSIYLYTYIHIFTFQNHYGINTPEDAGLVKALYEEFKVSLFSLCFFHLLLPFSFPLVPVERNVGCLPTSSSQRN